MLRHHALNSTAEQCSAERACNCVSQIRGIPCCLSLIRVHCPAAAVCNGQMREHPVLAYTLALIEIPGQLRSGILSCSWLLNGCQWPLTALIRTAGQRRPYTASRASRVPGSVPSDRAGSSPRCPQQRSERRGRSDCCSAEQTTAAFCSVIAA